MSRLTAFIFFAAPLLAQTVEEPPLVTATRAYARQFVEKLPDFVCLESVWRFSRRGVIQRLEFSADVEVSFVQRREQYRLLRLNGNAVPGESSVDVAQLGSVGEFGTVLRLLFNPGEQAVFEMKGTARRGKRLVHRIDVRVAEQHSHWSIAVGDGGATVRPAYSGRIFVDDGGAIIAVELAAAGFPRTSMISVS